MKDDTRYAPDLTSIVADNPEDETVAIICLLVSVAENCCEATVAAAG